MIGHRKTNEIGSVLAAAAGSELEPYRLAVRDAIKSVGLTPHPGRADLNRSRVGTNSRRIITRINNLFEYRLALKEGQVVSVSCRFKHGKPIEISVSLHATIGPIGIVFGYSGLASTLITGCRQMQGQLKQLTSGSGIKGRYSEAGTQVYVAAKYPGLRSGLKLWVTKSMELAIALSELRIKARAVVRRVRSKEADSRKARVVAVRRRPVGRAALRPESVPSSRVADRAIDIEQQADYGLRTSRG
jgi:hypothetical protein